MESWRQGLKAVAIYRDNSKGTQPLNVTAQTDADKKGTRSTNAVSPRSRRLQSRSKKPSSPPRPQPRKPSKPPSTPHHRPRNRSFAHIAEAATEELRLRRRPGPASRRPSPSPCRARQRDAQIRPRRSEGYITVGLYPNGQPGEIFIRMAKEGSTVSGLMDSFATAVSLALQHGVPLRVLCEKFAHTRFEPSGWTGNEQIGYAKSIMDYIFRWIQIRFLSGHQLDLFAGLGPSQASIPVEGTVTSPGNTSSSSAPQAAAPPNHRELSSCSEVGGPAFGLRQPTTYTTTPPQQGIAPDLTARSGLDCNARLPPVHRRPRHLPRRRRHEGHVRHGRLPLLRHLRSHHDPQRLLLPMHELRKHKRLQLAHSRLSIKMHYFPHREPILAKFPQELAFGARINPC